MSPAGWCVLTVTEAGTSPLQNELGLRGLLSQPSQMLQRTLVSKQLSLVPS